MQTKLNYEGKILELKEVLTDLSIGDELDFTYGDGIPEGTYVKFGEVVIPAGTKVYFGDNPFNGGQILVDINGNVLADIIIDEVDKEIILG